MSGPFIVMCAPNGARKSKHDHPALPVTPGELASCAESVMHSGASIIHTHVRDGDGNHSLDTDRYRAAIKAIRERVGDKLVIQVTTEACGIYTPDQQMAMVRELVPESVSVALRELCPDESSVSAASEFYRWMAGERIMAQHILYSADDVRRFEELRARGVIPDERPFVLFVLGRYSAELKGDVTELPAFIDAAAEDTAWAVCSFGPTELAASRIAAGSGGHIRVGFENNLLMPEGEVAPDNAALVAIAANAGREENRQPASADDVRSAFA